MSTDALPHSKPKAKWITVPIRGGRRRVAHKKRRAQSSATSAPPFDALSREHAEAAVEDEQETQSPQDDEDEILDEAAKEAFT